MLERCNEMLTAIVFNLHLHLPSHVVRNTKIHLCRCREEQWICCRRVDDKFAIKMVSGMINNNIRLPPSVVAISSL